MSMIAWGRARLGVGAAALLLMLMALPAASVDAGEPSVRADEQQEKIDELGRELDEMRRQQAELMAEVKQLREEITVAPPAAAPTAAGEAHAEASAALPATATPATAQAAAAPATIGQHISKLEQDLAQTHKYLTQHLGIHVHGLIDTTYEYNLNQPGVAGVAGSRTNLLHAFDTDPNGFQLQQFNLHIDRTAEDGSGLGFVTDLNFGKVAEVLRGATHYSNSATPPGTGEIDPTQAYLTYTLPFGNGINLSAGKFVTLLGAEVVKTYNDLNYNESGSYIFTLGIPFTHTGIRANYLFNDKVALTLGVNNGWDDPAPLNNGTTLEGQLALTPSQTLSIMLNGTYGTEQLNHSGSQLGIIDPVASWHTPLDGLTLVGEYLYAHEGGPVAVNPFLTGANENVNPLFFAPSGMVPGTRVITHGVDWQATAGYLIYDLNARTEFVLRGEYFRDSDGARTGLRQNLGEITFTTNYKLAEALLLRGEYRHDESSASPFFTGRPVPANLITPGIGPIYTVSGQDTFLGAMIYTF